MQIDRDVMVPMRDGTRLATDVYRPVGAGVHPALLQRTPYDRRGNALYLHAATVDLVDAVQAGYAVVVQDCRGRFGSEGAWEPFVHESEDGYDTVEWVAAQSWCDGAVGIYGNSYIANAALQAAVAAPPHLRAVFAYMGGCPHAGGWCHTNGVLELSFLHYWLPRGARETVRRSGIGGDRREELGAAIDAVGLEPWRTVGALPVAGFPAWGPELVPFAAEWLGRRPDSDYWRRMSVVRRADRIRVPVLHVTGAHDNLAAGHLALAAALGAHADPAVRDAHRFVFGPWDHEAYMSSRPATAGEVDFGPSAPNGFALNAALARVWFDRWLRGVGPGLDDRAPVSVYETGANRWLEEAAWPPPTEPRTFELDSDGHANTRFGDGRLRCAASERDGFDRFVYDPLDPVPTVGGRTLSPPLGMAGIRDQQTVEERPDVLVYTSQPLAEDLAMRGAAACRLTFSSSCEDTDLTAKLVDVDAAGRPRNVTEGITRARYRAGFDRDTLLEPGVRTSLEIPLSAVAHRFAAGHRIRLEVSSSNFPHFARNLNSRADPLAGGVDDARVAEQRVLHGPSHRSSLTLPVADR